MKKIGLVGVVVALIAVAAGCKKEDEQESSGNRQLLLGTWDTDFTAYDKDTNRVLAEREKAYFPTSSHLTYTFSDSGRLVIQDDGSTTPDVYNWTLSTNGATLRLIPQTDTSSRLYYFLYRLTANELVLQDTSNAGTLSWIGMVK